MTFPKNRFSLFALLWFSLIWWMLLKEASDDLPKIAIPHFDKIVHFALFFGQTWLILAAFKRAKQAVPYLVLFGFALLFGAATEIAQATLTLTRTGSLADVFADLLGAVSLLGYAKWKYKK